MPAGKLLWEPDQARARRTAVAGFMKWLEKRGSSFDGYQELWQWSVDDLEGFWGSVWKYFDVSDVDYVVLRDRKMPGAKWFDGSDVNFAERVFSRSRTGAALISRGEKGPAKETSWEELGKRTAALAARLRAMGVRPGDRVAAYLPNGPEAVVGFLASASVGAVWSSCSPDFGAPAVFDRFGQIAPKVLIATDGYAYGGKWFDRSEAVRGAVASLRSVEHTISVPGGTKSPGIPGAVDWGDAVAGKEALQHELVPFDHPLWILYSSGTTGLPKPIVHGHGGITVELAKALSLQNDVREGDRFFWFTTTGWMMWNYLLGGLLHGASVVLYNGNPGYPSLDALWDLAEKLGVTFMGLSAAFLSNCMKAGLEPGPSRDLSKLRGIGSTGSPLPAHGFEWVYGKVKQDVWLASISGGTDICTTFVGGSPILPVHAGEIQCRSLGAKVEAYDAAGSPVVGEVGELVVTEPMPSMPVFFWGDEDGSRYRASYFETYPGVWRHGDWIEITKRGTCVVHGRSDATIKRMGVRIGTAEIYRAVEAVPEVAESLAVGLEGADDRGELLLFVVPAGGMALDDGLKARIREKVKSDLSPKHVPDEILQVPGVPHTLNGKKLELPVKRILLGADPGAAVNLGSVANPEALEFFAEMARARAARKKA